MSTTPPSPRRLRVWSDVHTEFHLDRGRAFVDALPCTGDEIVLLPGDIATSPNLEYALGLFAARYRHVVFVPGNHDWFGATRAHLAELRARLTARHPNLHWLEESSVELDGVRFVGTTLWYPDTRLAREQRDAMSDFHDIPELESWIWTAFERAHAYLSEALREGDVVLTHHLPTPQSIAPRFVDSSMNCYFVGAVTELLLERRPQLWVHGHTHVSLDYECGATRVLCNPFGYLGAQENREFRADLCVEL